MQTTAVGNSSAAVAVTDMESPPALPATSTPTLAQRVAADEVNFILATFVDLNGKPCAKLVPAQAVEMLETEGVGFAGYAAGALGQQPSDPDLMAIPDPSSYTLLSFLRPGLAMVHCDPHVLGQPWPYAPRNILRAVLGRLTEQGLTAQVGAEAEYFLVRRDAEGKLAVADDRDSSARPCYDARDLTRMYEHLTEVSTAINGLGWSNYANDHEDGNGQFEQNFAHAGPMTTADRLVTFRYLVQVLAEQRGMTATFMPKPFTDRTGTGLHMHMSLWRDGEPLFPDPADPRGLGLSSLAYQFIGGLLAHAPALLAVVAPTVNSTSAPPPRPRHPARRGRRTRPPTAATTGRTWFVCRTATASRCGRATAPPIPTWPWPHCWPRAWTESAGASIPVSAARTQGCRCRPPCCTRCRGWPRMTW